jgi:hypothetical protein
MASKVQYKNNVVEVREPNKGNIVVYSHPGDTIELFFDISKLNKKMMNGDLIIKTLSGATVTIANYSVMFLSNELPVIKDILGVSYDINSILNNSSNAVLNSDEIDKYVLSRKINTPINTLEDGDNLNSVKLDFNDQYSKARLLGQTPVEQQSPNSTIVTKPENYETKTFFITSKYKYDVPRIFTESSDTLKSLSSEGDNVIPVININPTISPYYGTYYEVSNEPFVSDIGKALDSRLIVKNGGGELSDFDSAKYMYEPETIDLSKSAKSVFFQATSSKIIHRKINIAMPGDGVRITSIIVKELPEGVSIVSNNSVEVQPIGNGFQIIPRTQSNKQLIEFIYEVGMESIEKAVDFEVMAYNSKTKKIVAGVKTINLDLKPVNKESDVLNFSMVDAITYSTQVDPLKIITGDADDYMIGGFQNYIYQTNAGRDIFVAGIGNETVFLGNDGDLYYIGLGNDIADAGDNSDDILDYDILSFVKSPFAVNDSNIILGSGNINISYLENVSRYSNFEILVLDDKDNTITIANTDGLDLIIDGAGGFDSFKFSSAVVVSSVDGSATTNGKNFIYWANPIYGSFEKITGSNFSDTYIAGTTYDIVFDMGEGIDLADFSDLTDIAGVIYDYQKGSVIKGTSGTDTLFNAEIIYGTAFNDTFYGTIENVSITYYGYKKGVNTIDKDIVSYETYISSNPNDKTGIIIDFTGSSVVVFKKDGKTKDTLIDIEEVRASNYDDIFKVGLSLQSSSFDGFDGFDTLDYSKIAESKKFEISAWSATNGGVGNVLLGGLAQSIVDTFKNMEKFIGGSGDDDFIIYVDSSKAMLDGKEGIDTLDYSNIAVSIKMEVNLKEVLVKKGSQEIVDTVNNIESYTLNDLANTLKISDLTSNKIWLSLEQVDGGSGDDIIELVDNANVTTIDLINLVKAKNFEILRISDNKDMNLLFAPNVQYSYKTLIGASNGGVGQTGINYTLNSSGYTLGNIVYTINGSMNGVVINYSGISYNSDGFNKFIASNGDDVFNIILNDTSSTLKQSLSYAGELGLDRLDFTGSTINITFDLQNNRIIKGSDATNVADTFSGIESVVGGSGDDIFTLSTQVFYQIDGGTGTDLVSYEFFTTGIASLNLTVFRSIEGVILTGFDDEISFVSLNTSIQEIRGGGGVDTFFLDSSTPVSTTTDMLVTFKQKGSSPGSLAYAQVLNRVSATSINTREFEKYVGTIGKDTFVIESIKFSDDYGSSVGIFLQGGGNANPSIDTIEDELSFASNVLNGVELYLAQSNNLAANGYMVISGIGVKNNNLYVKEIERITLTAHNDTLYVITDASVIDRTLKIIDMGAGTADTIDFSLESKIANITFTTNGIDLGNGSSYNITGWERVIFGDLGGNLKVQYGLNVSLDGYDFVANNVGIVNLIIEGTGSVSADLTAGGSKNTLNYTDTSSGIQDKVAVTNIYKYIFDQSSRVDIKLGNTTSYSIQILNGTGINEVDYSSIAIDPVTFIYGTNQTLLVVKSNYVDELKGFTIIKSTENTDNFVYTYEVGNSKITYQAGNTISDDRIILTIGNSAAATSKFNINLTYDASGPIPILKTNYFLLGSSTAFLEIYNIKTSVGTNFDDTYNVTGLQFFENNVVLNGGGGDDILVLNGIVATTQTTYDTTKDGFYIDPSESKIFLQQSGSVINSKSISIVDIEEIDLSSVVGVHTLIFSDTAGKLKTVIGDGDDIISYENLSSALTGNIDTLNIPSGTITTVGFTNVSLTNFDDSITISRSGQNYIINALNGDDVVKYEAAALTQKADIKFENSGAVATITKNNSSNSDQLIGFSNFEFDNAANISMNINDKRGFVSIIGGSSVDYSLNTNVLLTFTLSTTISGTLRNLVNVEKNSTGAVTSQYLGKDSIIGSNFVIASNGVDIFNLNSSSSITTIITNAGNDILNIVAKTTDTINIVYSAGNMLTISGQGLGTGSYRFQGNSAGTGIIGIVELNGRKNASDNFEMLAEQSLVLRTINGGAQTNATKDILAYTSVSINLEFNMMLKTVMDVGASKGTIINDSYIEIEEFKGGSGNDKFFNLDSVKSYTLDGGNGDNEVSYDLVYSGINVNYNTTNSSLTIDKGGINDNLSNIKKITGSRYSDRYELTISAFTTGNYSFDGNDGVDTVVFRDIAGVTLEFDDNSDLIFGTRKLSLSNMENYTFTNQADNITYSVTPSTLNNSIVFNGGGDQNTFTIKNGGNITLNIFTDFQNYNLIGPSGDLKLFNFQNLIIDSSYQGVVNYNVQNVDLNSVVIKKILQLSSSVASFNALNISNISRIDYAANTYSLYDNGAFKNVKLEINNIENIFLTNALANDVSLTVDETAFDNSSKKVTYSASLTTSLAMVFNNDDSSAKAITNINLTSGLARFTANSNNFIVETNTFYSVEIKNTYTSPNNNVTLTFGAGGSQSSTPGRLTSFIIDAYKVDSNFSNVPLTNVLHTGLYFTMVSFFDSSVGVNSNVFKVRFSGSIDDTVFNTKNGGTFAINNTGIESITYLMDVSPINNSYSINATGAADTLFLTAKSMKANYDANGVFSPSVDGIDFSEGNANLTEILKTTRGFEAFDFSVYTGEADVTKAGHYSIGNMGDKNNLDNNTKGITYNNTMQQNDFYFVLPPSLNFNDGPSNTLMTDFSQHLDNDITLAPNFDPVGLVVFIDFHLFNSIRLGRTIVNSAQFDVRASWTNGTTSQFASNTIKNVYNLTYNGPNNPALGESKLILSALTYDQALDYARAVQVQSATNMAKTPQINMKYASVDLSGLKGSTSGNINAFNTATTKNNVDYVFSLFSGVFAVSKQDGAVDFNSSNNSYAKAMTLNLASTTYVPSGMVIIDTELKQNDVKAPSTIIANKSSSFDSMLFVQVDFFYFNGSTSVLSTNAISNFLEVDANTNSVVKLKDPMTNQVLTTYLNASFFTFAKSVAHDISVGASNGVFAISNKIIIQMDASIDSTSKYEIGESNLTATSTFDTTSDVLRFSNINVGEYYWSGMVWGDVSTKNALYSGDKDGLATSQYSISSTNPNELIAPAGGTTREALWANANTYTAQSTVSWGVGFAFNSAGVNKAFELQEGRSLNLLYKISGVEEIVGTSTSDIWSYGTFYKAVGTSKLINPFMELTKNSSTAEAGDFNSFNAGNGIDTFLMNSDNANNNFWGTGSRDWAFGSLSQDQSNIIFLENATSSSAEWNNSLLQIMGVPLDTNSTIGSKTGVLTYNFEKIIMNDWGSISGKTTLGITDNLKIYDILPLSGNGNIGAPATRGTFIDLGAKAAGANQLQSVTFPVYPRGDNLYSLELKAGGTVNTDGINRDYPFKIDITSPGNSFPSQEYELVRVDKIILPAQQNLTPSFQLPKTFDFGNFPSTPVELYVQSLDSNGVKVESGGMLSSFASPLGNMQIVKIGPGEQTYKADYPNSYRITPLSGGGGKMLLLYTTAFSDRKEIQNSSFIPAGAKGVNFFDENEDKDVVFNEKDFEESLILQNQDQDQKPKPKIGGRFIIDAGAEDSNGETNINVVDAILNQAFRSRSFIVEDAKDNNTSDNLIEVQNISDDNNKDDLLDIYDENIKEIIDLHNKENDTNKLDENINLVDNNKDDLLDMETLDTDDENIKEIIDLHNKENDTNKLDENINLVDNNEDDMLDILDIVDINNNFNSPHEPANNSNEFLNSFKENSAELSLNDVYNFASSDENIQSLSADTLKVDAVNTLNIISKESVEYTFKADENDSMGYVLDSLVMSEDNNSIADINLEAKNKNKSNTNFGS